MLLYSALTLATCASPCYCAPHNVPHYTACRTMILGMIRSSMGEKSKWFNIKRRSNISSIRKSGLGSLAVRCSGRQICRWLLDEAGCWGMHWRGGTFDTMGSWCATGESHDIQKIMTGIPVITSRLGKNSLISGIDRNRCQNRKVSIGIDSSIDT